jgi:hypothetical protein
VQDARYVCLLYIQKGHGNADSERKKETPKEVDMQKCKKERDAKKMWICRELKKGHQRKVEMQSGKKGNSKRSRNAEIKPRKSGEKKGQGRERGRERDNTKAS